MKPMIRAAALRGFVALVDERGGDGSALLRRHGIEPSELDSADAVIDAGVKSVVLEEAAAELRCPDLGLHLAGRQDASVLGPLAVAIENSLTLREAVECASRFMFVYSPALGVTVEPDPEGDPDVVALVYSSTQRDVARSAQAMDLGLGLMHRVIWVMLGGSYELVSVHLPHPALIDVSTYADFFNAPVAFDKQLAALRVPAALTTAPFSGGNQVVRDIAIDYLARHFNEPEPSAASRVETVIAGSLGSTPPRIAVVSRLLLVHPRTLQRQLADEGTSFEAILDDVRRRTAHRLITSTDLPFAQVTSMVGLAEQSALTRASRRWFGRPPRQLRQEPVALG